MSLLPISFYLLKHCKLWIWDFDDTLIDGDTYIKKNMSPDAIINRSDNELDLEIPQWRYFKQLVEFLILHGKYVGIASFGTYEIIQAYMNRIMGFNQKIFTKKNIIAPCITARDVYRFNLPANKNEYIYNLMQIYRIQDFNQIVLFDDKSSNIADAIAIGIIAIQIDKPKLFGPWVMDEFDNKVKTTYTDENYLNKTYTNCIGNDTVTPTIHKPAFGTGIGDRKVLMQPSYRWRTYTNDKPVPKWHNGNYINIPNLVNTKGYWPSPTYDKEQSSQNIEYLDTNIESNTDNNTIEKFSNSENSQCKCKSLTWNWIILILILLIVMMVTITVTL